MAASLADVEHAPPRESVGDHPLLREITEAVDDLRERGTLPYARAFAIATRTASTQILISARASGAHAAAGAYLVDVHSALPPFPSTLQGPVAVLRELLRDASRSTAIFIPAPHLTAFAVAGVPLPIVYGSGLLRRTPEPLPVVPWTATLDVQSVLNVVNAHPRSSAVLLANRGVLAYADESISKLARFVVSLEESAQLTINAQLLGGARALPPDAYEQMQNGIAGD